MSLTKWFVKGKVGVTKALPPAVEGLFSLLALKASFQKRTKEKDRCREAAGPLGNAKRCWIIGGRRPEIIQVR